MGLPAPPANLVHGPDGHIVASVRRDPTLFVIDPAAMRVVRTLRPQWPADLAAHGGRAINVAFDAQGRVAIATGGGHAVALFDAQGAFVARTPADLYQFTNGLWWSPRGLWSTDTNRFTLRLLDAATLQPIESVELGPAAGGRFLGPARARPAAPGGEPQVALIRFLNNMVDGQVSLVQPGQPPLALPGSSSMQPRDLDWLGDTLLVSDGTTLTVRRWSAQGQPLPAFGGAALQQRLRGVEQERQSMRRWHRVLLAVAAGVFLLGLAAALVAQRAARRAAPAPALDLSQLGTPQTGRWAVVKMNLRINGMLLGASVAVLALNFVPKPWLRQVLGDSGTLAALVGVALVMLLLALASLPVLSRRIRRLARDPALEPAFNTLAMNWLRGQQTMVAGLLRDGERVLETLHLSPGMTWCLLTDQRLLVLSASLAQHRLARAHELSEVRSVSRTPTRRAPSLLGRMTNPESWLEVTLADGTVLSGALASATLAERAAQRIEALAALKRRATAPTDPGASPAARVSGRRRWLVLASLLLPGSAHAWLRQGVSAIVLGGAFAALLMFVSGPMLWTLVEPYVAVSARAAWTAAAAHAGLALLAALDAWRVGSAARR